MIALIKARERPRPRRARALVARAWPPGLVTELLERAGAISTRPRGLAAEFGLNGGGYRLSEAQAQAILDMRLHRLTGLERDKIIAEYRELLDNIRSLSDILARPERLTQVVRGELLEIRAAYGDARRTEINRDHLNLTTEDLIEPQDVVVTLSHAGYAKSQPLTEYQTQRRGGRGKTATAVKDEDFVEKLFVAHTHDTVLCFSNRGKVYWLKVYELPQAGRGARGKPMVNLLPLEEGEKINALLPVKQYDEQHFVFMATRAGTVKKTPLAAFSRPRSTGIIARRPARQRPAGGRGAHRRRPRDHAGIERRQGDPLPRARGAPHGARGGRRARHPPQLRTGADRAHRDRRRSGADRLRRRLRQADAARGFPRARPRRPGRDRAADLGSQR